jgi:hypothetical protein
MRFWEAVMKGLWGTDERCRRDRAEGERMIAEAERKVGQLNAALDKPPRNLDETLYQMTRR